MDPRQAVKQAVRNLRLVEAEEEASRRLVEAGKDDEPGELGEFQTAEYVIFVLALDTYIRYSEEKTGEEDPETDAVIQRGVTLLRKLDSEVEQVQGFLDQHLPTAAHKKMLTRAFRMRASGPSGVGRRSLGLRTVLNRGGATTMRAVFETNKALRQVREAIAASMLEDASDALKVFASFPLRNQRIRYWVRMAAKTAGLGFLPKSAVAAASDEAATGHKEALLRENIQQLASSEAAEVKAAGEKKVERLAQVETEAKEAAKEALDLAGEPDEPLTRSEVVGVATAAAVAAATDPSDPQNVPAPLRMLDEEQRSAALTDGRVLVAAGAGAGKSTTLVARIGYLVKERRVLPSRILATSFNTKAANELKEKIGRSIGGDALQLMSVGTMHSLFRRFIGEYGTGDEKTALGLNRGGTNGFVQTGSSVARTVQRMWEECFNSDTRPTPRMKNMLKFKSQWSGNNITPADAHARARNDEERDAADWYEMYEGLKGSLPGWEPPCEEKSREVAEREFQEKVDAWRRRGGRGAPPKKRGTTFETFMARYRPADIRLGDFDDMLSIFRDILKREPAVRKALQKMYDHIMVDECQDLNEVQSDIVMMMSEHVSDGSDGKSLWMVGDDKQCVAEDTLIQVGLDTVPARELRQGSMVMAYRNGSLEMQEIRHVKPSSWTWGYKVTTESGKTLTMSPNHKIWADGPYLDDEQVAVYLMYRRDMGFRVGITNKCKDEEYLNSFGGRAFLEKAERMWVLEVCPDREAALLAEESYSLTYGVPTMVFEGEHRGLNQDRITSIFESFGKNGGKILEAKHLSFDLPHWMSQSYTKHGRDRRTVQMTAHGSKGTQVALEWSGDDLDDKLEGVHFVKTPDGRRRLRKWFTNYRAALEFAEAVASKTSANLSRRLSTEDGPVRLVTASGVFPGMKVVVFDGNTTTLEAITHVEKVDAKFVDLDVEDASNFFGGGILSHNSIYGFRGARPDLFTGLHEKEGWKTRMIKTNYRCEPEIVDVANKLIAHNEGQIPMEARPNPGRSRGIGSIRLENPMDEAEGALRTIEEIKGNLEVPGAEISENAILCRTNKELHAFETACIVRGIPYARKGASSFLGSPETSAVLGYVQLAMGDDFSKMQKALGMVINKPNRFFVAPDAGARAVEESLSQYARKMGQSVKDVNPLLAMRDSDFVDILAEKLAKTRTGFKFDKTVEQLEDLARSIGEMQANSTQPGYGTKDLFEEILGLRGTASAVDPNTGRTVWIEQSFRESLQADLRDAAGDDDEVDDEDEADETKGLGNISFLFKLAEVDPTDPLDLEHDPGTPSGFKSKMERLSLRMRDLRVPLEDWERKQAALPPDQRQKPPGVYLGTVHSVKGAQWDNTYVQMPKGKFPFEPPQKPGAPPPDPEEVKEQLESERRLAYVALTRAAKHLTVLCPNVVGGKRAGVSPFADEAGLTLGENVPKVGTAEAAEAEAEAVTTKEARQRLAHDEYEGPLPEGWDPEPEPWEA